MAGIDATNKRVSIRRINMAGIDRIGRISRIRKQTLVPSRHSRLPASLVPDGVDRGPDRFGLVAVVA